MAYQHSSACGEYFDRDRYTSSQAGERVLNEAIVQAEIIEGFDECLKIFDAFYDDDVEVSSETQAEPIRGKARVRSLLFNFLVPFHVMAEVGGLSISIRATAIPADTSGETHSAWTLDLVAPFGTTCTLSWCALRKWDGSRVVYEHHYDRRMSGGALTFNDFRLNASEHAAGFRMPS